jgi:hypothetical protein
VALSNPAEWRLRNGPSGSSRPLSAGHRADIAATKLPLVAKARRVDDHSRRIKKTGTGMTKGLLGGIPGEEDERPKVEALKADAGMGIMVTT